MCRIKVFIIVAILSGLVLTFNSIGLACGAKPTETPTSPPPVSNEQESTPWTSPQLPEQPVAPAEPAIPADFKTYTDDAQLFSISYPADWEADIASMADVERKAKESLQSKVKFSTEIPIMIFFAGKRTGLGNNPSVNILVEPSSQAIMTHEQWIEAEMQGAKEVFPDFKEFSRVKTTVDGREATIVDWEGTLEGHFKTRCLQMFLQADETPWVVTCGITPPSDFVKWKNDFDAIVRSLRVSTEIK